MRFCPFCSAENADEMAACQSCGRRLPPLPPRRAGSKGPPTGILLRIAARDPVDRRRRRSPRHAGSTTRRRPRADRRRARAPIDARRARCVPRGEPPMLADATSRPGAVLRAAPMAPGAQSRIAARPERQPARRVAACATVARTSSATRAPCPELDAITRGQRRAVAAPSPIGDRADRAVDSAPARRLRRRRPARRRPISELARRAARPPPARRASRSAAARVAASSAHRRVATTRHRRRCRRAFAGRRHVDAADAPSPRPPSGPPAGAAAAAAARGHPCDDSVRRPPPASRSLRARRPASSRRRRGSIAPRRSSTGRSRRRRSARSPRFRSPARQRRALHV